MTFTLHISLRVCTYVHTLTQIIIHTHTHSSVSFHPAYITPRVQRGQGPATCVLNSRTSHESLRDKDCSAKHIDAAQLCVCVLWCICVCYNICVSDVICLPQHPNVTRTAERWRLRVVMAQNPSTWESFYLSEFACVFMNVWVCVLVWINVSKWFYF